MIIVVQVSVAEDTPPHFWHKCLINTDHIVFAEAASYNEACTYVHLVAGGNKFVQMPLNKFGALLSTNWQGEDGLISHR